jgi:hypothetical protein
MKRGVEALATTLLLAVPAIGGLVLGPGALWAPQVEGRETVAVSRGPLTFAAPTESQRRVSPGEAPGEGSAGAGEALHLADWADTAVPYPPYHRHKPKPKPKPPKPPKPPKSPHK